MKRRYPAGTAKRLTDFSKKQLLIFLYGLFCRHTFEKAYSQRGLTRKQCRAQPNCAGLENLLKRFSGFVCNLEIAITELIVVHRELEPWVSPWFFRGSIEKQISGGAGSTKLVKSPSLKPLKHTKTAKNKLPEC